MSDNERIPEDQLVPTVGALIFASGEPVAPAEIGDALGGLAREEIEQAVDALDQALDRSGTGLRVERVAGGFRLATRADTGAWVRRFFRHRNRTRLTPAALETLAIVAYRQPVTAPEVQAIRGKDSSAALKSLLEKKMIRILGKKKVVGNPLLYGTRREFLVHFGLDSLKELPSIEEFDEFVGALEGEQGSLLTAAADGESEVDYETWEPEPGDEAYAAGVDAAADPDLTDIDPDDPLLRDEDPDRLPS